MEGESCLTCDVCRVAYASDQELQEHSWSLMHHIKIEQTKKGAPHSCSLCMETCANIIEYGKHLNADKHKMALSRQTQGGSDQMLNSLGLIPLPKPAEPINKNEFKKPMDDPESWNREHFESFNRHSRSFSQPSTVQQDQFKYPAGSGNRRFRRNEWRKWQESGNQNNWPERDERGGREFGETNRRRNSQENVWNSMNNVFQGMRQGHQSPNMEHNRNDQPFYDDSFGIDWKDNQFYTQPPEMHGHPDRWVDSQNSAMPEDWGGTPNSRSSFRKPQGSFDEGFRSRENSSERRGRGILRGRHHMRTGSYDPHRSRSNEDRFSPESNSSTDSNGLKRRLEDGDFGAPEKSRRTNMSSGRFTPDFLHSTMEDDGHNSWGGKSKMWHRSRNLSREKMSQSDSIRRSRSHSGGSSRRVTWSDQQGVSSTTDVSLSGFNKTSSGGHASSTKTDLVAAVPDSSTEIKKKKKKGKGGGKKNASRFTPATSKTSQSTEGKSDNRVGDKDSTESVLEKAEKLCKKLRNEREKVKQQKITKEKQKKIDKTEELNTQIAELSKENMKKITGHLETVEKASSSDTDKFFDTETSLSESKLSGTNTFSKLSAVSDIAPDTLRNFSDLTAPVVRPASSSVTSSDPRMAERIAQTRADIDAIRAKIEGSVHGESSPKPGPKTPSPAHGLSPLGTSKSSANNKSLLKMVNAPRTTKERLHVAQLLRNHAKSQTRYSFPRFNLKMSDLVENHSEIDEELTEFSLESLTPSVQLEIANLIEADIKPDVAELQLLLDAASSENAELDLNILSDLGITQTPGRSILLSPTPNIRNSPSPSRQRTLSTDSQPSSFITPDIGNTRVPDFGRSGSPTRRVNEPVGEINNMDDRPSLSVEELVTEVNKAKEHMLGLREWERTESVSNAIGRSNKNAEEVVSNRFTSSLPISTSEIRDKTSLSSSLRDHPDMAGKVKVKIEREDDGYDFSVANYHNNHKSHGITGQNLADLNNDSRLQGPADLNRDSELQGPTNFNRDSGLYGSSHLNKESELSLPAKSTLDISKVHRSVHTRTLYPSTDELPVRDTDRLASNTDRVTFNTDRLALNTDRLASTTDRLVSTTDRLASNTDREVINTDRLASTTSILNDNDSTVDRVNAILNAVPNMDNILTTGRTSGQSHQPKINGQSALTTTGDQTSGQLYSQTTRDQNYGQSILPTGGLTTDQSLLSTGNIIKPEPSILPTANMGQQPPLTDKDKHLDSSVNSNTSSVLDQVYSICVEEENVRSEIDTVDAKIDKLKSLINEAQLQLGTFNERKKELAMKESEFRTSRMRLLQENRSLDGSIGSQSGAHPSFNSPLSEAQILNLSNPVLMKFLMSQRQSDLSSVGGYSNVESGSQPEDGQTSQRRGSMTSVTSSGVGEPVSVTADTQKGNQNMLFSQSIDILSGSTDTLNSLPSEKVAGNQERDSGTPIPTDHSRTKTVEPVQENIPGKSFSLLKKPLENFVTLEALMNGDAEIGKLIHKSLESIQRGEVKQEEEVVIKSQEGADNGAIGSVGSVGSVRNRRESVLSVGSDDMCISGSDNEKRAGKVSMKYMGTLHEGVNYDSIVKHISSGGKNKPIMFTVLSSPEPMVTGKTEFDLNESPLVAAAAARRSPDIKPLVPDLGLSCDKSPRSDTASTLDLTEVEVHSARSNFSLGEQIKRMCDGHTGDDEQKLDTLTPRSESSGEKTLEDETVNKDVGDKEMADLLGMKDCYVKLDRLDMKSLSSKPGAETTLASVDSNSPIRKKLKSKRERDQKSRRKQKESFVLQSDTNSEEDKSSRNSRTSQNSKSTSKSEEDLVVTGSEDSRTPRPSSVNTRLMKRSLLDEVQLETETLSESGEDKSSRSNKHDGVNRLTIKPGKLESFRNNVKTKLQSSDSNSVVEYKGPPLSVMAIQLFKGDVYVCYNGSELRRFDLKTGKILRELDCSPYLVNCLHVTSVEEREDILYTTGACKKLMLFNPNNFSLITTYAFSERIVCLHENWGRLFVGMSDGSVGVRSLKTDKELNQFSCTTHTIHCLTSASAGMTKMLCLGTADKIIYILDAISGLLITMLEGHMQPPLCIQVIGEKVISASADHTILVHNVSSGHVLKTVPTNKPLSQLWTDGSNIYAASQDQIVRMYDPAFKMCKLHKMKGIVSHGMIGNDQLFTGFRNGMVEAIPLSAVGRN